MKGYYEDKTVLVTGGTGFIGSRLVRALLDLEAKVHVLVRPKSDLWRIDDIKEKINFVQANFDDPASLELKMEELGPVVVFNLMGDIRSERSQEVIRNMVDNNVFSLVKLASALRGKRLESFVTLGSLAEYGDTSLPFKEDQPAIAISPYGLSKLVATQTGTYLSRTEGFPITILRLSLVYGPGQVNNQFMPEAIRNLLRGEKLHTTPLDQTRDFIYVDDVVYAMLKAPVNKVKNGEIINVCSGEEVKLSEVLKIVCELTGRSEKDYVIKDRPYLSGEQMRYVGSRHKARELLGWEPKTPLREGIMKTIEYNRRILSV